MGIQAQVIYLKNNHGGWEGIRQIGKLVKKLMEENKLVIKQFSVGISLKIPLGNDENQRSTYVYSSPTKRVREHRDIYLL